MSDLELLCKYLNNRDVPCPSCNYNLRGLTEDRCPECDEALSLQLSLVEARPNMIGAVLAGLWSTFGAALAAIGNMLYLSVSQSDWLQGSYWLPHIAALTLAVPLLHFFCSRRGRAWLGNRSPIAHWIVVLLSWLLFFASGAIGVLVVFLA